MGREGFRLAVGFQPRTLISWSLVPPRIQILLNPSQYWVCVLSGGRVLEIAIYPKWSRRPGSRDSLAVCLGLTEYS